MSQTMTAVQMDELEQLLRARHADLRAQMVQNRINLEPAEQTAASASQDDNVRLANQMREVDSRLTAFDAQELARITQALERMTDGSYGHCDECGCLIPFERLKAEPMTQHCVPCKSRWEQEQTAARR